MDAAHVTTPMSGSALIGLTHTTSPPLMPSSTGYRSVAHGTHHSPLLHKAILL